MIFVDLPDAFRATYLFELPRRKRGANGVDDFEIVSNPSAGFDNDGSRAIGVFSLDDVAMRRFLFLGKALVNDKGVARTDYDQHE